LSITQDGIAKHNPCISHCLQYAFDSCQEIHYKNCTDCENLFIFFEELKKYLPLDKHRDLDEYQKKLIAFMSHHARKIYLNAQLPSLQLLHNLILTKL